MIGLIVVVLLIALVAYVVQSMKLPEPYGKVLQVLCLCALIYAIYRFALSTGWAGF